MLRAMSLLGEASGISVPQGRGQMEVRQGGGNHTYDTACILAESQHLFWQRLERLMEEVERHENGEGGGRRCDSPDESESSNGRSFGAGGNESGGGDAEVNDARGGFDVPDKRAEKPAADSELPELLGIFRLLASRSLLPRDNGMALEALVFPSALSRRRYVLCRAKGMPQPHILSPARCDYG